MYDIPGFEGRYAVDEEGRVFSYRANRFLRPGTRSSGHVSVVLYDGRGNRKTFDVHILVGFTFLGRCPTGKETRHLDGDPTNNRLANLSYGTRRQNKQDMKWHKGCEGHKLKPADVLAIRALIANGVSVRVTAKRFGVSPGAISHIKAGRSHADV